MTRFRHEVSEEEVRLQEELERSIDSLFDKLNNFWGELMDAETSDHFEPHLEDIKREIKEGTEPILAKMKAVEEARKGEEE